MKITQVSYKTNAVVGSYRTKHVEATATVDKGEDPRKALLKLAAWVHRELGLPAPPCRHTVRNMGDE